MQICLQFDTITVILDKRVKSQGIIGEELDFTIVMQHILHEGLDNSKLCFFSLTP